MRRDAQAPTAELKQARTRRTPRRTALLVLLASLAALALAPAAYASKGVIFWAGSDLSGSADGELSAPRGVAVNSTGAGGAGLGDFYVAEASNSRVSVFSATGMFKFKFGSQGAGAGQLAIPTGIAIDQADGSVFIYDQANRRVSKYSANGTFLFAFGAGVVDGTNALQTCVATCVAGLSSTADGGFGTTATSPSLAVVPPGAPNAGDVIVADAGNAVSNGRRIQAFSAPGATGPAEFQAKVGSAGAAGGQFGTTSPRRVAVDDAGRVYAVDSGNSRIQRFAYTSGPPALAFDAVYGATELSGSAPSNIAISTGSIHGGDASDDRVFVTQPCSGCTGAAHPSEVRIKEFGTADDPALIDTHIAGVGILNPAGTSANGLAVNNATGRLFLTAENIIAGQTGGRRAYAIDTPLPLPSVTMDSAAAESSTTATFAGTVNPQGGQVNCEFEYSPNQIDWSSTDAAGCASLTLHGGLQPVSQPVTGLLPNTHYYVRLKATRPFPPNGSTTSVGLKVLDTDAIAPIVTNVGAVDPSSDSVRLVGTIDPANSPTGYVFEYGTTPALGQSTAPVDIGAGTTPQIVSQLIGGLQAATTYYFRLVATSSIGTTTSSGGSFTTRSGVATGIHRAYEKVTPADKNFGKILLGGAVAPSGDSLSLCNTSGFGDPPQEIDFICATYVGRRGGSGWSTSAPVWPNCKGGLGDFKLGGTRLSPDFSELLLTRYDESASCVGGPLDPAAPLPADNVYLANLYGEPDYRLLTPVAQGGSSSQVVSGGQNFVDGNSDFSRVFYVNQANQSGDAPAQPPLCSLLPSFCRSDIYEWHQGQVTLQSRDVNGVPFATQSTMASPRDSVNGLAADGTRFFFHNANELFMRVDGSGTFKVSEKECTTGCSTSLGSFEWATDDGEAAFFTSTAKLTADDTASSGADLYRYLHSDDPVADQNLTLLSRDEEPADGTSAGVLGVSGISDDGKLVYFVATGQLLPGEPIAAGPKLYRWDGRDVTPVLEYLATLDPKSLTLGPGKDWPDLYAWRAQGDVSGGERPTDKIVSADGKRMILQTTLPLEPVADSDSDADVYRWDEDEGWTCLSCQVPGDPSAGDSLLREARKFYNVAEFGMAGSDLRQRRVMAEDGEQVFFTSYDELVEDDINGDRRDLYEWREGSPRLVTSGTGVESSANIAPADNLLLGIGADGRDVFFVTSDRLVGWDTDELDDVYDARVGGGFPEPPASGEPCQGGNCRGSATGRSPVSAPGSATAPSAGNVTASGPPSCGRKRVRRSNRCVSKARLAHRRCRKQQGRAKRRCVRRQLRRLSRADSSRPRTVRASRRQHR